MFQIFLLSLRLKGEEILKYHVVCRPPRGNVWYSNDHVFTQKCDFSVLDQKYSLWANFIQKFVIVNLSQNLVHRLIQRCRIQWWGWLFCFWLEKPFLGKFGPEIPNFLFTVKFGAYIPLNMQNSIVIFCFSVFDQKNHFSENLVQKIKIVSLN